MYLINTITLYDQFIDCYNFKFILLYLENFVAVDYLAVSIILIMMFRILRKNY